MRFAVLQFPGSNSDQDYVHVLRNVLGQTARLWWHKEETLGDADAVIISGGFSYGDYLRAGAIARFSPVMKAVVEFANSGGLVLGVCNGFQILCEAGLLPGALVRNRSLQFRSEQVYLKTENSETAFSQAISLDRPIRIPIAHGEGCYFVPPGELKEMESNGQVLWRYVDSKGAVTDEANPNGSVGNIAGVCNKEKNVAGLMPHPERAAEEILGSADGVTIFKSMINQLESKVEAV